MTRGDEILARESRRRRGWLFAIEVVVIAVATFVCAGALPLWKLALVMVCGAVAHAAFVLRKADESIERTVAAANAVATYYNTREHCQGKADAHAAELEVELKRLREICLAGEEPGVWPCGCRVRVDSHGIPTPLADAANPECDHHAALRARVEPTLASGHSDRTYQQPVQTVCVHCLGKIDERGKCANDDCIGAEYSFEKPDGWPAVASASAAIRARDTLTVRVTQGQQRATFQTSPAVGNYTFYTRITDAIQREIDAAKEKV